MGGERWHNVEHRDIHTVHALNGIFYEFFPCIICIWNLFFKRRKDNSDLDNLQRLWEMKLLKFLSSPFRYLHFSNAHVYQWGFFFSSTNFSAHSYFILNEASMSSLYSFLFCWLFRDYKIAYCPYIFLLSGLLSFYYVVLSCCETYRDIFSALVSWETRG